MQLSPLEHFRNIARVAADIPQGYSQGTRNRLDWVKSQIEGTALDEPCCGEGKETIIGPFSSLDLSLSDRCNLNCGFCYTHGADVKGPDFARTKKAIDWFLAQGSKDLPLRVNVFGGEPLVEWPDLLQLDDYLRISGRNYRLGIITNMTLLDESKLLECLGRNIDISPSIDGCPDAQDYHRRFADGTGGTANVVAGNAKRLLEHRPNAKVRMTVTPETTLLYYVSVRYLCEALGFKTVNAVLAGGAQWNDRQIEVLKEQVGRLTEWWIEEVKVGRHWSLYYLWNMYRGMWNPNRRIGLCEAGSEEVAVATDGSLWPCHRFCNAQGISETSIGHIDKPELNQSLRKAIIDCNVREQLASKCGDCEAKPSCHAHCLHEMMLAGTLKVEGEKLQIGPTSITCKVWPFYWAEAKRAAEVLKDNALFKQIYKPAPPKTEPVAARVPTAEPKGIAQDRLISVYEDLPPIVAQAPDDLLVSVIIASRDEGQELVETAKSVIAAAEGKRLEVIVVDDASKIPVELPGVTIIRNDTPLGVGRSRQIGIAASTGRIVALIDAHMRFPVGLWHRLGKIAIERRAILNPGVQTMHGGTQGFGTRLTWHRDYKLGIDYERTPTQELERRTGLIGACYVLPREVIDQLGGWVCTLGLWGHDEEAASAWAWLHDVPILTTPDIVKHLYRSEINVGNVPVPWGNPPLNGLFANVFSTYRKLFEFETFEAVFTKSPDYQMYESVEQLRDAATGVNLAGSDAWRKTKTKTDYELFRDVLKRPCYANPNGSISRLAKPCIIMCACNEGPEVLNTLVSIVNAMSDHYQIIAVDDASTDGSFDRIVERVRTNSLGHWVKNLHNRLKVIRNAEKIGVPQSRRKAIEACPDADVYITFDGHMRAPTVYGIESLCAHAIDKQAILVPQVAGLGASENPNSIRTYGAKWKIEPKWGVLCAHINERPQTRFTRIDAIIGACYAIPRTVLEKLGGWPDLKGHWAYDEQEIGFRAYLYDIPIYCDASVVVEHKYKTQFNYPLEHSGVLLNAHRTFALHFPETYRDFWLPLLLPHGAGDLLNPTLAYLNNGLYIVELAEVNSRRMHTEQETYRALFGIEDWPPKPQKWMIAK